MSSFITIYPYCLALFGIIIIGLSFYKIWCSNNAKNWNNVPAKIIQLKILVKDFVFFKTYTPRVSYTVLQDGKIAHKHGLTISKLSFYSKSSIDSIFEQNQLSVGNETLAYQNPIFKSSYILVPGLEKKSILIVPLLLFVFATGNLLYNARTFNGFSKPYSAVELYEHAYDLMEKRKYELSYDVLKASQSLDSSMIEAYYLELELADHLPYAAQAKQNSYDNILRIDPSKSDVQYNRASLLYDQAKYQLAIQDYKQYLQKKKDADGAYNLALCYLRLGINDSAKVLLLQPEYSTDKDCRSLLETIE